ncbi:MAG: hypothetical protein WC100_03440 [Sterolibacterium sp.]
MFDVMRRSLELQRGGKQASVVADEAPYMHTSMANLKAAVDAVVFKAEAYLPGSSWRVHPAVEDSMMARVSVKVIDDCGAIEPYIGVFAITLKEFAELDAPRFDLLVRSRFVNAIELIQRNLEAAPR